MKHYTYKTLRGILSQCANYFTYDNFVSGHFVHKTHGWVKFTLSEQARQDFAVAIAGAIWDRIPTNGVRNILRTNRRNYGIYSRLWVTKEGRGTYCAGQDYISEIRTVRQLINA